MATAMTIKKANDKTYVIRAKRSGAAISTAGWTVFFTVKKKASDTDEQALITKNIDADDAPNEPENGIIYLNLTHDDTDLSPKSYVYDLKVKDAAGKLRSSDTAPFTIVDTTTDRES